MQEEQNKEVVTRYLNEVWIKGNIEGTASFFLPGYLRHTGPAAPPLDVEGQANRLRGFRTGFPDVSVVIEDMIAEGDMVAFRFTFSGTHQGVFQGIEPTGVKVSATGVDMVRLQDGLLAEHWGGVDMFGLVRQIKAASGV